MLADLRERVAALDGVGVPGGLAPGRAAAADLKVQDEVARTHVRVKAVVLVPEFLLGLLAPDRAGNVEHVALLVDLQVGDAALVGEVYERLIFIPDSHSPSPSTSYR